MSDIDNTLVLFQNDSGAIELPVDATQETIWATQAQMAELFDVTPQNITMHLKAIFDDNELDETATCKESLQVRKEGSRTVRRKVKQYNLDVIIAVGYKISSKVGTEFRKWATQTLKSYIVDGYAVNKTRIVHNNTQFLRAMDELQELARANELIGSDQALDLTKQFASTWLTLDAYDKGALPSGGTKRAVKVRVSQLYGELTQLKSSLIKNNEATDLFAKLRDEDGLESIFGNILQSFGGDDVYSSLEEKAANLLYMIVKNHIFYDGNKRSGAFAFVWFLREVGLLNATQISPPALSAITLLVAQSDPKDKDKMIGLIKLLLGVKGE